MTGNEIIALALELMSGYDELEEWNVKLSSRMKVTAGLCSYTDQQLVFASKVMARWDEDDIKDTVLHEIAHALAGPSAGHGPEWKAMCRTVGARPERCYSNRPSIEPRWTGTCPKCHHQSKRHRRGQLSCGKCSRVFDPTRMLIWTEN